MSDEAFRWAPVLFREPADPDCPIVIETRLYEPRRCAPPPPGEPPFWVRLADREDADVAPGAPRVDMNRCKVWIRYRHGPTGDRAERDLCRTPGGSWFVATFHEFYVDGWAFGRAWRVSVAEAAEWFLGRPDVEPPDDVARAIAGLDATHAPAEHVPPPALEGPAVAAALEAPPPSPPAPPVPAAPEGDALNPGSRALAAAYQLKKAGKPVSVRAACKLAKVDRETLRRNYPESQAAVEAMAEPDRAPRRGFRDRRTGDLHALDSDDREDGF